MPRKVKKTKKEEPINIDNVIKDINKKLGNIIKYGSELEEKERLPFGIPEIDKFTGGGAVAGNFIILYGGESVGKTSLALHQIAELQKKKKVCVYIDLEHGFNKDRAKLFGVDLKKLIILQDIDDAEQALDVVIRLAKENIVDYIVIDSVQALSPRFEQQNKTGTNRSIAEDEMALLARKLGKFLRIATSPIAKSKIGVVLIGQIRTAGIGGFITKDDLSGGHALKHWSLLTMTMRRGQKADAPIIIEKNKEYDKEGRLKKVKSHKKMIGFSTVLKLEKVKISGSEPEGTELKIPYYFDTGFKQKDII